MASCPAGLIDCGFVLKLRDLASERFDPSLVPGAEFPLAFERVELRPQLFEPRFLFSRESGLDRLKHPVIALVVPGEVDRSFDPFPASERIEAASASIYAKHQRGYLAPAA